VGIKPTISFNADDTKFDNYVASLHEFLINQKKTPKKWWSFDVTKLLLQLHLEATEEFGVGQKGASFMRVRSTRTN
jgi:hypothetical protein